MNKEKDFDIDYIARLARIKLDETSKGKLAVNLCEIVGFVDQLGELDIDNIEPTAHAVPLTNVMREDSQRVSFPRELMLANAPESVDGEYIKVLAVLPGEGES